MGFHPPCTYVKSAAVRGDIVANTTAKSENSWRSTASLSTYADCKQSTLLAASGCATHQSRTIQIQYTLQRIINPLPKFATLQQLTTSPLKQTFRKLSHCWQLSGLVHDAVDNMNRPRQTGAVQQGVVGGGK